MIRHNDQYPTISAGKLANRTHGIGSVATTRGNCLNKPTNAGVFQADVLHSLVLGIPAVERYPLHPAAIGPFQAVAEQVPLHLAAFASQVGRGHPFDPKRQWVTAQLLGQRRVQYCFAIVRPPGNFLLGLLPDLLNQPVDVLLDVAGIEDRLGVQLLEDRPRSRRNPARPAVLSTPNSSRMVASFSSRTSWTRSSTLSSKIRLNAFTGSFWPIRSTRPMRCSILHRVPGQVVVDDDVGELQVQTFATGVGRNKNSSLLCELPLDPPPFFHVHRTVKADDREAMLLQEVPKHVLRRHEFGEDQVLQLRVVLVPLILIQDVEQGFGPCVRPLRLTAPGQIEQQPHFLLLVFQSGQAGSQQFVQLLLAILLLDVVFSGGSSSVAVRLVDCSASRRRSNAEAMACVLLVTSRCIRIIRKPRYWRFCRIAWL